MTQRAQQMRDFRHANEKKVMLKFSRTWAGKRSTTAQVKAAARLALRNHTAKF